MYLEDMDITSDDLDAQMDWDSFASVNTVMKMTDTTIASDPDTIAALALSPDPVLNFTPSIRPPPQPPPQKDGDCLIPPGSTVDPGILLRPMSPNTPLEFPFQLPEATYLDFNVGHVSKQPLTHDSIKRVVGLMRVCGLTANSDVLVKVSRTCGLADKFDIPSLIDGGANICLTGTLDLLMDDEDIAPLHVSVATAGGAVSVDDCCTKKGLLPISLDNGSIYYQPCYYCKIPWKRLYPHKR